MRRSTVVLLGLLGLAGALLAAGFVTRAVAMLLLGDNRGASDDSRFWGPVPAE